MNNKEKNKTIIRWFSCIVIVFLVCSTLLILNSSPYEIRFSADTNVRDSIIASSEAIKEMNTIVEQPLLLDKDEFAKYCINRNPPSVISCVVGCLAYEKNEHKNICGEGVTCYWDGELDCNSYCKEKYG